MDTILKKTWHDVKIRGVWKLVYIVGNSQGPSAFGGKHLPTYPNPFTGQKTYLRNVDDMTLTGHMVDKVIRLLHPEENENERLLISWLICHPDVIVEGVKDLDEKIIRAKRDNKVKLICITDNELEEFDNQDFIDKIIGRISLENGKGSIGIDRLRYVLAYLNMAYTDPRFEGVAEKKSLRSKLKNYVRKDLANAKQVSDALENINVAQDLYEFKEMVRLHILKVTGGVFRFNGIPLGSNADSVLSFLMANVDVKTEILAQLYKKLEKTPDES